ncbi:16S rRNA (guanine(527)-N(7))-methyltransferase RsmG [Clostridia bacterium]|nr:16S rRNA (guanine(527)-N(7))-methyltransferase RsmG [Clostridia bacterium]
MENLNSVIGKYNIQIDSDQLSQLSEYNIRFQNINKVMNLSAIREPKQIEIKHFLDSLIIAKYINLKEGESLLDLGTGGGFPGLPIKVMYPEAKVYFLDSVRKKLDFIRTSCEEMGINNVQFLHMRAEDAGQDEDLREKMNVVVARAVAYLPVLVEYAAPLLQVGGLLVAAKMNSIVEIEESRRAIKELGMVLEEQHLYTLPEGEEERQVLILRKVTESPKKYPRKAGIPKKSPL